MKRSRLLIIYAFSVVMLLMISVITFSLIRADGISKSLQKVSLQQNIKSDLVFKMREGQLKRILVLRNLYLLDDPFAIDEERMRFYSIAREVDDARNKLLSMDLFPSEVTALNNFVKSARSTSNLQNQIIDDILEGKSSKEITGILKQAFLDQEVAMDALQHFQVSLNTERNNSLDSMLNNNNQAKFYILILTVVASLLAIAIIIYIILVISKQEKTIDDEHKKFKTLFDKNMDGVVLLRSNKVVEWNQKMQKLFKTTESNQLKNIELYQLSPLTQSDNNLSQMIFKEKLNQLKSLGDTYFEWQFERFDGSLFYAEVNLVSFNTNEGVLQQVVIKDITERKKAEQIMHEQANYDFLTGLPNRILFLDRLKSSINRASRFNHKFALLFLDLDRFKHVNDTMGHLAGDVLLKMVAVRLESKIRSADTVARLGGDEFTIILDDISEPNDAALIADSLINEISKAYQIESTDVNIGVSIGITIYPDDSKEKEALLSHADMAMYQAKQSGRNKYHFFTQELNEASKERHELERDLRHAIEEDEFELYFQPIINIKCKKIECAEALIRWNHPLKGLVSPLQFIPIAEELGLIRPLTQWVLKEVCQQLVRLKRLGLDNISLSMNLPASEKLSGLSTAYVSETMLKFDVSPSNIVFEITESLLMDDVNNSIIWLNSIRDLGIKTSIDDFGTGYSSLSYLRQFPIDTLKIDRSFINHFSDNNNDQYLVDAIIAIANSLELGLVAEGVETLEQLHYFQKLQTNCPLIQGYYFSKPLPSAEFESYINDFQM